MDGPSETRETWCVVVAEVGRRFGHPRLALAGGLALALQTLAYGQFPAPPAPLVQPPISNAPGRYQGAPVPVPPAPLAQPPITSAPAPYRGLPPGYMSPDPYRVPLMPGAPAGSLLVPVPTESAYPEGVAVPVRAAIPGQAITLPPGPPQPGLGPAAIAPAPAGLPDALAANRGAEVDDLLSSDVSTATNEITVPVRGSRIFDLALHDEQGRPRRIRRVLIADESVAEVDYMDANEPNPHLLKLFGASFGTTTLTIWFEQPAPNQPEPVVEARAYRVRVTIDTADLETRLGQLFSGADVKVRQVGSQVVLEGQVPNAKTMAEVLQLVQAELGIASLGSGTSGAAQPAATAAAAPAAGGAAGGATAPTVIGSGSSMIINRVRVPGPRQVLLRVRIAELNRTALRQLGVSWLDNRNNAILGSSIGAAGSVSASGGTAQSSAFGPSAFLPGTISTPIRNRIQGPVFQPVASTFNAAGQASTNEFSQLFGIFNAGEFNLFLNVLRQNNLAKILAEPNLMALDGQPASFQAGGSFPYPVPQAATAGGGSVITIQFAEFGAILQFLPIILENDVIRLDVAPTFSDLNFAQGTVIPGAGVVPGLNQRNARTVVELREGQTLAIAGLLSTRTNATSNRVPGLGDLPIVGPWFSNNRIETLESELVVLVSPELVEPMETSDVPAAPGDTVLEPTDYEFYFLGRLEGRTGKPFRSTIQYLDPLEVMKHLRSENTWVIGPHGHAE